MRISRCGLILTCLCVTGYGHDAITTKVTYDREIVRLMISHCGSCHRDGGSAFSLMTYDAARPWAKAIGEEVLQRRMPPWGAVKGFGDFRNDKGLTEEQLELIADWEEGGAPEGDPKDLPATAKYPVDPPFAASTKEFVVSGDTKLTRQITLGAIWPKTVSEDAKYQVIAELPDGGIEPLVWFQNYSKKFDHPFVLRRPLELPVGTMIRGVPAGQSIALIPGPGVKAGAKPEVKPERVTGKLVTPRH